MHALLLPLLLLLLLHWMTTSAERICKDCCCCCCSAALPCAAAAAAVLTDLTNDHAAGTRCLHGLRGFDTLADLEIAPKVPVPQRAITARITRLIRSQERVRQVRARRAEALLECLTNNQFTP